MPARGLRNREHALPMQPASSSKPRWCARLGPALALMALQIALLHSRVNVDVPSDWTGARARRGVQTPNCTDTGRWNNTEAPWEPYILISSQCMFCRQCVSDNLFTTSLQNSCRRATPAVGTTMRTVTTSRRKAASTRGRQVCGRAGIAHARCAAPHRSCSSDARSCLGQSTRRHAYARFAKLAGIQLCMAGTSVEDRAPVLQPCMCPQQAPQPLGQAP